MDVMLRHSDTDDGDIIRLLLGGQIVWAGNSRLKIYGTLRCKAGKRMMRENRVFFATEAEARAAAYRPCGQCCRTAYKLWRTDKDAKDLSCGPLPPEPLIV